MLVVIKCIFDSAADDRRAFTEAVMKATVFSYNLLCSRVYRFISTSLCTYNLHKTQRIPTTAAFGLNQISVRC